MKLMNCMAKLLGFVTAAIEYEIFAKLQNVAFSVNCVIVSAYLAAPTTYVLAVGAVLAVIAIVSYD